MVQIKRGRYLWGQSKNGGMVSKNTIHVTGDAYVDNYGLAPLPSQGFFIHELTHVYQFQKGVPVKLRGAIAHTLGRLLGNPYEYKYVKNRLFKGYGIEKQGEIMKHYFYVNLRGVNRTADFSGNPMATPEQLRKIVSGAFK